MNKTDVINELAAALGKAQAEIKVAEMNSTNPFLKNKYADLGSVIQAARPALAKNNLSFSQLVAGDGTSISVETVLMHSSGQWIASTVSLPVGEERGKSQAQVAGSIVTYLRRYALAAILGVYADEDTDGNPPPSNGNKPTQTPAKQAAKAPAGQPAKTPAQPAQSQAPNKPDEKAWTAWYKLVEEAESHGVIATDPPDDVTVDQLRTHYAQLKKDIEAAKAMQAEN